MDNYRPRWRSDAEGAGGVSSKQETYDFIQCAVSLLLSRQQYDQTSLGDLVENMEVLPEKRQLEVWDLIDAWATRADESALAELRERIRRCALTRVGRKTRNSKTIDRARLAYERLEPRTPMVRYAWLFASPWVQESADEFGEDLDFQDRGRRIDNLRRAAMEEIWAACGLHGVLTMVEKGNDPWTLGRYAALCVTDTTSVLQACLGSEVDEPKIDMFMRAIIMECANPAKSELLLDFSKQVDSEQSKRLWGCAPFKEKTWRTLEKLPAEAQDHYWRTIQPDAWGLTSPERAEVVERLLAVGRPQAAFVAVKYQWKSLETALLMRLLAAVVAESAEEEHMPAIERHDISEALEALDTRPGVTMQEMSSLEFAFVQALGHSTHGIPNLERLIATSPAFFVHVISRCFKRRDGGEDPLEWRIDDETRRRAVAENAYHLLAEITLVPGTKEDCSIDRDDLLHWVKETRQLCAQFGRTTMGDQQIGQLLARAPEDDDGIWPCKPVCEALEAVGTKDIERGFIIGKRNMRGAFIRTGEGGEMERELAADYRRWAQYRRVDYPFAGRVLTGIAESYRRVCAISRRAGRAVQAPEHVGLSDRMTLCTTAGSALTS